MVDKDGHPFQSLAVGRRCRRRCSALNADVPVVADPKSTALQPDAACARRVRSAAADARVQTLLKLYNTYPNSAPYAALLDATAQTAVHRLEDARRR